MSTADLKAGGNAVVRKLNEAKQRAEARADRLASRLSDATNKRRETVRTLGGAAVTLGSGSLVAALKAKFPQAMQLWDWKIPVDAVASGLFLAAAALGDDYLSDDSIAFFSAVGEGSGTVFLADLIREALSSRDPKVRAAAVAGFTEAWGPEAAVEHDR